MLIPHVSKQQQNKSFSQLPNRSWTTDEHHLLLTHGQQQQPQRITATNSIPGGQPNFQPDQRNTPCIPRGYSPKKLFLKLNYAYQRELPITSNSPEFMAWAKRKVSLMHSSPLAKSNKFTGSHPSTAILEHVKWRGMVRNPWGLKGALLRGKGEFPLLSLRGGKCASQNTTPRTKWIIPKRLLLSILIITTYLSYNLMDTMWQYARTTNWV